MGGSSVMMWLPNHSVVISDSYIYIYVFIYIYMYIFIYICVYLPLGTHDEHTVVIAASLCGHFELKTEVVVQGDEDP